MTETDRTWYVVVTSEGVPYTRAMSGAGPRLHQYKSHAKDQADALHKTAAGPYRVAEVRLVEVTRRDRPPGHRHGVDSGERLKSQ